MERRYNILLQTVFRRLLKRVNKIDVFNNGEHNSIYGRYLINLSTWCGFARSTGVMLYSEYSRKFDGIDEHARQNLLGKKGYNMAGTLLSTYSR